jgi:hypothetical protein
MPPGSIAGGLGLLSDRYKLMMQAKNFETASDAFACIAEKLEFADAVSTNIISARSSYTPRVLDPKKWEEITEKIERLRDESSTETDGKKREALNEKLDALFTDQAKLLSTPEDMRAFAAMEDAIAGIGDVVRSGSRSILRKLIAAQRAVTIVTPDADQIRKSLEIKGDKPPAESKALTRLNLDARSIESFNRVKQDIDTCIKSF